MNNDGFYFPFHDGSSPLDFVLNDVSLSDDFVPYDHQLEFIHKVPSVPKLISQPSSPVLLKPDIYSFSYNEMAPSIDVSRLIDEPQSPPPIATFSFLPVGIPLYPPSETEDPESVLNTYGNINLDMMNALHVKRKKLEKQQLKRKMMDSNHSSPCLSITSLVDHSTGISPPNLQTSPDSTIISPSFPSVHSLTPTLKRSKKPKSTKEKGTGLGVVTTTKKPGLQKFKSRGYFGDSNEPPIEYIREGIGMQKLKEKLRLKEIQ